MPDLTRRTFIKASALAGTAMTIGAVSARVVESGPADPTWTGRPMRWGQLTLVEDDPGTFDPQFWLDYFRRTHCDAVCLSAGGCVAYYQPSCHTITGAPGSGTGMSSATL